MTARHIKAKPPATINWRRRAQIRQWCVMLGLVLIFGLTLFVVLGGARHPFFQDLALLIAPPDTGAQTGSPASTASAATGAVLR